MGKRSRRGFDSHKVQQALLRKLAEYDQLPADVDPWVAVTDHMLRHPVRPGYRCRACGSPMPPSDEPLNCVDFRCACGAIGQLTDEHPHECKGCGPARALAVMLDYTMQRPLYDVLVRLEEALTRVRAPLRALCEATEAYFTSMVERRERTIGYPQLPLRAPYDEAEEWERPCRIGRSARPLLTDADAMREFLSEFIPTLFTTTQFMQPRGVNPHDYLLQEVEIHLHDGGPAFKRSDAQISKLVDDGGDPTPSRAAERVKKRRLAFLAGLKKPS